MNRKTTYNPRIHHRRSIRLKGYDYSQPGLYFITLCCQDRIRRFGHIKNGEMHRNLEGNIVYEEWLKTEIIRRQVKLHEFIVMPDHFHGIVEILFSENKIQNGTKAHEIGKFKSPSQTIGAFIRGFKSATTKRINMLKGESLLKGELRFAPERFAPERFQSIWQRDYFERIIRNQRAFQNISAYIANNPAKWERDQL